MSATSSATSFLEDIDELPDEFEEMYELNSGEILSDH